MAFQLDWSLGLYIGEVVGPLPGRWYDYNNAHRGLLQCLPLLFAALRRRHLCLANLLVVQKEVLDLHDAVLGQLRFSFLPHHLHHLACTLLDLDHENDTENDPMGSHLVDCSDIDSLLRRRLLGNDDFRGFPRLGQ